MTHVRTTGRRLAAAILTVSTVTAVAGTLVTAPAFAAPAAVRAAAETPIKIAADAEVVSAGTTGFLTARPDGAGGSVLTWTTYDGSSTQTVAGAQALDTGSDHVITVQGSRYTVYDAKESLNYGHTIDIVQALGTTDARLVGVTGNVLWVTKPDGYGDPELHRLVWQNGMLVNRQMSHYQRDKSFKVLGHTGWDVLGVSTRLSYDGSTTYHRFMTDMQGDEYDTGYVLTGAFGPNVTGALSPKYSAWTEYANDSTQAVVVERADSSHIKRFDLGAGQSSVIAGLVGDSVVSGKPGGYAATAPDGRYALTARSLTDGTQTRLLDYFSTTAVAPDGSLLVRGGSAQEGDGLFRVSDGGGYPTVTRLAGSDRPATVQFVGSKVPEVVDLEKNGGTATMEWTVSHPNSSLDVTFTHVHTGKKFTQHLQKPDSDGRFALTWNGTADGISAPNGSYAWEATASTLSGIGGTTSTGAYFRVTRTANPHDFNDNGSTDVLARDSAGVLWRDDLFDRPSAGQAVTAKRTKVGTGWNTYKQIEAVGNIAGSSAGDLVALDGSGYLWQYQGRGDGSFAGRVKVGGGWGGYTKLTGGSDLNGDRRPDLLAADASGTLWLYKGTGSSTTPFATRVRVGGGWGIYNQLTAVGNIASSSAGDLVARDASGVLWLYQGNGAGGFSTRVKVGSGWGAFSQLVGAGDVNADGRPDLIGYGAGGTYVYKSTGSATAPFARMGTNLYAGEGTKFNSVA
ncbi:FG-GAP repeat domain-containing protein [Streptomyces sp. NPDC004284]|uniref:FG-GAP repeat domain-containing protein n=1 Tax=Streptomyces sp. NPDC004284 TaxID=3364695 RepID=UPI0036975984